MADELSQQTPFHRSRGTQQGSTKIDPENSSKTDPPYKPSKDEVVSKRHQGTDLGQSTKSSSWVWEYVSTYRLRKDLLLDYLRNLFPKHQDFKLSLSDDGREFWVMQIPRPLTYVAYP